MISARYEILPASLQHACAPRSRSRQVALAAINALYGELILYPKPGLVSKVDNGSHHDMTAALFVKSLFSLRHYFSAIYLAGRRRAGFEELQHLGIQAEARMLCATQGVNTHRGAIFNLGILSAAVGRSDADGGMALLQDVIIENWAAAIKTADSSVDGASNGSRVCRKYAVGGARGEAAAGFPHVFKIGLPALQSVRHAGGSDADAAAQAFFSIMLSLQDTNLLHRAGPEGLHFARNAAHEFLLSGGVLSPQWQQRAALIHQQFVVRRLSPGGSADLLAATLFVDRLLLKKF